MQRDVGISGGNGEDEEPSSVDGLVGDGCQHGPQVYFVDCDQEAAGGAQRRGAVVRDDDADLKVARALSLGRGPRERPCLRINGGTFGRTGTEGEGERLRGAVWIGRAGSEGECLAFINGLIVDRRQSRG